MDEKLLALADKKIEQMERYNDITSKMIYEDIDGVGEIIDRRQEIITSLDGISAEMKQYVSDQSIDRQEAINKVLQSEDIDIGTLNGELLELQAKIKKIAGLKDQIHSNDVAAMERLQALRDETYEKLVNSAKGKQTMNYITPNSGGSVYNGNKLNITQ